MTRGNDGAELRYIDDQIVHPNYVTEEYPWDVMVLRLNSPVSKQYVRLNSDPSFPRELAELSVMGFGDKVDENDPDGDYMIPDILQEATVNYIGNTECGYMHADQVKVTGDMLCAEADGRDACTGMLERVAYAHGLPRTYPFSLSKFLSL